MTTMAASDSSTKGFFGKLFDLSFDSFITTGIIKVLYVLFIIGAALGSLALLVSLATQGGGAAVVGVILAPIAFLLYVILGRIYLEIVIVLFRIAENTQKMADNTRQE